MILLRAQNPSPLTLMGTNTYLLGEKQLVVIDPGPYLLDHLQMVLNAVHEKGELRLILLTHHHSDHAGGAAWLKDKTGSPIAAHEKSPAKHDKGLCDGELLEFGSFSLQAFFTPGHSADHLSFYCVEEKGIFTGDLILGEGSTTINPPDGNLRDYMNSLFRMKELGASRLFPGHGPEGDAKIKIEEMIRHRKERHKEILRCLERGISDPVAIVAEVYGELDLSLRAFAAGNVLAHLQAIEDGCN